MLPEPWQIGGFGLYVHWPFCQSKCPYCDFNSHVVARVDQSAWADALVAEIRRYGRETPDRHLSSIFFGGGTPSLMHAETVEKVISAALETWTPANDIEISLEANPSSVEIERFTAYRTAGVNRLSLGVQSLVDDDLRALGRLHTVRDAMDAVAIAKSVFDRTSLDLIYGRQDQTPDAWQDELEKALSFNLDHYALYQLTIEPNTAFGARFERGLMPGLPDEDRAVALWDITQDLCEKAGLEAYEVSNHAQPGSESRHNLIYWNTGDWVGVGPGAHGRFTVGGQRIATEGHLAPGKWLNAVADVGHGESVRDVIGPVAAREEAVVMGLRLLNGIDVDRLQMAWPELPKLNVQDLRDQGLVRNDRGRLRATDTGRLLLNSVIAELLDV